MEVMCSLIPKPNSSIVRRTTVRYSAALGLLWLASTFTSSNFSLAQTLPKPSPERIRDPLELPLKQGNLAWWDLLSGVAEKRGWELDRWSHLANDSDGWIPAQAVGALTMIAGDSVFLTQSRGDESLVVDLDKVRNKLRKRSSELRQSLPQGSSGPRGQVRWLEATRHEEKPKRAVLIVPGFQAPLGSAEPLGQSIHKATGLPVLVYSYPNDAPIAESGRQLYDELRKWELAYPELRFDIVTHSMGGLVARFALEVPSDSLSQVDRLIQICPPNHGSELALYAAPLELVEHFCRSRQESNAAEETSTVVAMIRDGLGEAKSDLRPNSLILSQLNQCERHRGVRYTILAGTQAPLAKGPSRLFQSLWNVALEHVPELDIADRKVTQLLNCDELRKGSGDGVVSVKSARLDGVEDLELLECNHLDWNRCKTSGGSQILGEIVERLTTNVELNGERQP